MQQKIVRDNCSMEFNSGDEKTIRLTDMLADFEKAIIINALNAHDCVKARTAAYLGLNRTTLVEKCRKYDLGLKVAYLPKKSRHGK